MIIYIIQTAIKPIWNCVMLIVINSKTSTVLTSISIKTSMYFNFIKLKFLIFLKSDCIQQRKKKNTTKNYQFKDERGKYKKKRKKKIWRYELLKTIYFEENCKILNLKC